MKQAQFDSVVIIYLAFKIILIACKQSKNLTNLSQQVLNKFKRYNMLEKFWLKGYFNVSAGWLSNNSTANLHLCVLPLV